MLATYNGEKFLREQLNSICDQTLLKNILLYVGDDGSSDSTLSIINEYKSRINILERTEKSHLGAALNFWNLLLTAPEADYYAFCDQDDIWDKDKLEIAVNAIKDCSEPTLYHSNFRMIDSFSKIIKKDKPYAQNIIELMTYSGWSIGCTMFFNNKAMEIFKKLKLTKILMHDTVTKAVILVSGKIVYDEIPRISYRQHENNVTARSKSNFFGIWKKRYELWFKNKHLMSILAKDLLCNFEKIDDENTRKWLQLLCNYRRNFSYKLQIFKMLPEKANLSFKIRLLLGLI
jgi:rhamnosyltransferase